MARRRDTLPAEPWQGAPAALRTYREREWSSPDDGRHVVAGYGRWLDARADWWAEHREPDRDAAWRAACDHPDDEGLLRVDDPS